MRPLLLEEFAEIFILDVENPVPFDEDERLDPVDVVLNYLPGLVVKVPVLSRQSRRARDSASATEIKFAHFSISEYLNSGRAVKNQPYFSTQNHDSSHLHIPNSCLALHLQLSASTLATTTTMRQYRLWAYAAQEGMSHLEKAPYESWTSAAVNQVTRIFLTQSQALLNIVRLHDRNYNLLLKKLESPLYYAAERGYFHLASQLIKNGGNVNEVSPHAQFGTPIAAAALFSYKAIVKLILQHRVDVNKLAGRYGSALQAAMVSANLEVIQLLLDHNANVNIEGGMYGSVLQAAARWGGDQTLCKSSLITMRT